MSDMLKKVITIEVTSDEEKMAVGTAIHNQLVGCEDYINNNIILNIDNENKVLLLIFEDCVNMPKIEI